jgi:hypothetical protein
MARPSKDKEIDLMKAVTLRIDKGLSFKEIGKILGVAPQTIQVRLKRLGDAFNDPSQVAVLKQHEPLMIDGIRGMILERMGAELGNPKSNISFSQLALGYGIMLDKARLIRGESTAGNAQLSALIIAAHKQGKTEAEIEKGKGTLNRVIDVTPEKKDSEGRVSDQTI